jgi:hypothetical protein
MAAGGFKEFVAGEVLDEDEINDFLMQGVLVFAGTAARGSAITSPVEGQFSFLSDSDSVEFYDGSDWVELSTDPKAAVVSGTTGSPTLGTVTSGSDTFNVYTFTGDGSIIFSEAGLVDFLVISGGGTGGRSVSGTSGGGGGGAGGYLERNDIYIAAGTATVVVGAGGAPDVAGRIGLPSRLGSYFSVGGGCGMGGQGGYIAQIGGSGGGQNDSGVGESAGIPGLGNNGGGRGGGGAGEAGGTDGAGEGGDGLASSITGTSVTRAGGGGTTGGGAGGGGASGVAGGANTGGGGGPASTTAAGAAGGSGVVIVRVKV